MLKQKAYWMATILLETRDDIAPQPDGRELLEVRWFGFDEAIEAIRRTNHAEKAELLVDAIRSCERDLLGGESPAERAESVPDRPERT